MQPPVASTHSPPTVSPQILSTLKAELEGDVRFDPVTRTLYATDASIYEILPACILFPKTVEEVQQAVRVCAKLGVPIISRGGGTGLTGGAVGWGVQVDFSRHMNEIGFFDSSARTVEVQPGVVLDQLNKYLKTHGVHFAPDVATSSRATIGGMIANNSCGAHSVLFGRTVDHIVSLDALLSTGEIVRFNRATQTQSHQITEKLRRIRDEYWEEIDRCFPKTHRSNAGYGLDRLGPPEVPIDVTKVICGSEGTLGIIVAAKLNLTPLPTRKALLLLHFDQLRTALSTVPAILEHKVAAIELIDRTIIAAGRVNPLIAKQATVVAGNPEALLIVEVTAEADTELNSFLSALQNDARIVERAYATVPTVDESTQADVWSLRKQGLGLLMSNPGDSQPYAFIEDCAVDPTVLPDYIARIDAFLKSEGVEHITHHAHASAGCLHVRPAINLKEGSEIERMRRIAEGVSEIVREFGGTTTGEHGDGIVRSCWLERLYGSRIIQAFREVKEAFDPAGIMNPGKIVNPLPFTENLRFGATFHSKPPKTYLDFSLYNGLQGMAQMCSGVGVCRQRDEGTMCPSYRATGEEKDSTRGRANALRIALSNKGLIDGLDDPALADVLDLCLSCKACKSECPTNVDMTRMKAEYLNRRNQREGVPRRSRLIANMPRLAALGSRFPWLANTVMSSSLARKVMENHFGLDRRIAPPHFVRTTFRKWFARHSKRLKSASTRGDVVYFVDTWTNYFTPHVGKSAVKLLEAAGYRVVCPPTVCCGRPMISHGLLPEAKCQAEANLRILARYTNSTTPIVGTEPSCVFTLVDEYPQLLRSHLMRKLGERTFTIEAFLWKVLSEDPEALRFHKSDIELLYHAHCHQKAMVGTHDANALMKTAFNERATEIPSGCCGMAGSFGHEAEHYDIARKIAEETLIPAIEARGNAKVAVSGFSCHQQIEHHTSAKPRHLIEYLADALDS